MGHYLLKDAPKTGTGDLLISVQAVEPIKLPSVTHELNIEFKRLLEMMIANCSDDIENEISQKIFNPLAELSQCILDSSNGSIINVI